MNVARCRPLGVALLILGLATPAAAGSRSPAAARENARSSRVRVVVPVEPWGLAGWWWYAPDPYWYGPPYPRSYAPYPPPVPPAGFGALEIHLRPSRAVVSVDGAEVGQARDFGSAYHPLLLKPGQHEIALSSPGYRTLRITLDTSQVATQTLRYRLEKGEGVDLRSSPAP